MTLGAIVPVKSFSNSTKIKLKSVFNNSITPVMTFGLETMSITVKSAHRLRTTHIAIERLMLVIRLRLNPYFFGVLKLLVLLNAGVFVCCVGIVLVHFLV